MKFVVIVSCLVLCNFNYGGALKLILDDEEGGYYWRDYTGRIPRDAFPAGKNKEGKRTYIGQALHHDLLIPGNIDPDLRSVVYEYKNLAKRAIENVKILCTRHPSSLEWILTNNDGIRKIEGFDLINGGFETNTNTYVGRARKDGEITVGKLLVTDFGFTGLHFIVGGKAQHFNDYEVLGWNPSTPTSVVEEELSHEFVNTTRVSDIDNQKCSPSTISINVYLEDL